MRNSTDQSSVAWRTSSYSTGGNQCVEVGPLRDGVAIRDSKDRVLGAHVVGSATWTAFIRGVRTGRL